MNRRSFLQTLGGTSLACASALPVSRTQSQPKRPNIVLILADDMGCSDLGCYGSEIATPNIDALARRGIRFTQFQNNARCCPSRATILTGLYSHQTGIGGMTFTDGHVPGYRGDLNRQCVTIAEVLRSAGYHTLMTGKWHVTHDQSESFDDNHNWPLQRGFEKYFGTIAGAGSYYDPYFLVRDNRHIQAGRKNFYYTDALAENAANFIGEYAAKPEPFFLYAAFTAPHWPLQAPPAEIEKYKNRYSTGWDDLRHERHRRMIDMGIVDARWPLSPRDPRVPEWKDAKYKQWQARRMAVYAAQIDRLDQGVGRILRKLKETGVEDNTVVLFLSDNGACAEEAQANWNKIPYVPEKTRDGRPMHVGNDAAFMPGPEDIYQSYGLPWANASNTPLRLYKHYDHEGGISTPLIVAGAGIVDKPGSLTHQHGHIIDIMPTLAEIAGAKYPKTFGGEKILPVEGLSLLPVLQGNQRKGHDAVFWEHEGNRAVRQGKWKIVSQHPPDKWELYDMEADRTELHDLSAQYPERVKEMAALWLTWANRCHVFPKPEVKK